MTLQMRGSLTFEAGQAKAELKSVGSELKKVGADGGAMARGTREAADSTRRLEQSAAAAAVDVNALAAAERGAAQDAVLVERTHTMAAGSVGNLTAQFNDIGVMMAAGQSPLQLAIQQGTQITQVFEDATTAAEAFVMLREAFLSMLSPVKLLTIGAIAAGAAIFQWLTQADEGAQTLEDGIGDLTDRIDDYIKINGRATSTTDDLRKDFGAAAQEARALLLELSELSRIEAERATRGSASGLRSQVTENSWLTATFSDQATTAKFFDLDTNIQGTWKEVNRLLDAFDQVDEAANLDETIAAYGNLKAQVITLADLKDGRSADEQAVIGNLIGQELELLRLQAERQRALSDAAALAQTIGAGFQAIFAESLSQAADVAATVAELNAEEAIRNQILILGRDSELVQQNILAIEREKFQAAMDAQGATEAQKDALTEAWDAAKGFNAEAAGMPGLMAATASAASGIAHGIWNAVTAMVATKAAAEAQLKEIAFENSPGGQALNAYGGRSPGGNAQQKALAAREEARIKREQALAKGAAGRSTRGGTGGGGTAAREEADAVGDLIEKLQREIELEREMDPIKREMIRHRETLADATATERAQVEELIVQREREKAATESLQWASDQAGDSLIDAMMGGADAGERLIETLKRAVLQALLLGEGPLASLFGGGGGGGLFSGLGGLFGMSPTAQAFAEGGMVFGDGGPRDDKVSARLSAGEFVMNARATRRHRHMLEGLNAAPGFADGGIVGRAGAAAAPGATGGDFHAHFDLRGSQGEAEIRKAAMDGMQAALTEYRRTGLPADIRRANENPRVLRF